MNKMKNESAVAILPYGCKLGVNPRKIPLNELIWPLGQPPRLHGKLLSDLTRSDHLILYPTGLAHIRPSFGTVANISMMVVEPPAIHGRHLKRLRWSHRRFHRVLTADENLLENIPNGLFLPFGSTWVPHWQELDLSKSAEISLIASSKKDLEGHKLRHKIVDWAAQKGVPLDVMGGGYKPFSVKSDGLAQYRFSVIIENTREKNYFTEKLIDAVLCETVPIYWGCTNISEFIDVEAMILCETEAEVKDAILNATPQLFLHKLPNLKKAKDQAIFWADLEKRAALKVLSN